MTKHASYDLRAVSLAIILLCTGCASGKYNKKNLELKKQIALLNNKIKQLEKTNENQFYFIKKYDLTDALSQRNTLDDIQRSLGSRYRDYPDIEFKNTDAGLTCIIGSELLFNSASDKLNDSGDKILSAFASALNEYGFKNNIIIECHTDNQKMDFLGWKSNLEFSSARAIRISEYLSQKKNIDPHRIASVSLGDSRPRATNDTKEGRSKNRRVEITLLGQQSKPATQQDQKGTE